MLVSKLRIISTSDRKQALKAARARFYKTLERPRKYGSKERGHVFIKRFKMQSVYKYSEHTHGGTRDEVTGEDVGRMMIGHLALVVDSLRDAYNALPEGDAKNVAMMRLNHCRHQYGL